MNTTAENTTAAQAVEGASIVPQMPNLLWAKYTLAIEARDKLQDNFHKWMTYYYVAIAAIIVAVTTIYKQTDQDRSYWIFLLLGLVAVAISTFWHFSCKGYYYWSKSWMDIIFKYEQEINGIEKSTDYAVFTVFSKKIAGAKQSILNPVSFANISTPKLTLLFSFFSILCWMAFSIFFFFQIPVTCTTGHITISLLFILIYGLLYSMAIPEWVRSKDDSTHRLIE